jgi:hypothetical protein
MAFETFDVIRMQGKTMTWSFYLKAGSNFSPAGAVLGVQLNSGTGTDQGPFSLHTGEVNLVSQSPVITTTGTRFSYTFTVPTNATSMRWNIATTPVGTAGTNDFYEIADMQLEIGSQATPFARAGGSIGGELALCQRYYWRTTSNATAATVIGQVAIAASTTVLSLPMKCPVTMRVAPTSVDFSSLAVLDPTVSRVNVTAVALDNPSTDIASVSLTSSGLTAQRTYVLYNQSAATGFIGFSAEL